MSNDKAKVDRVLTLRDSVSRLDREVAAAGAREEEATRRLAEIDADLRAHGLDPDGDLPAQIEALAEGLRADIETCAADLATLKGESDVDA